MSDDDAKVKNKTEKKDPNMLALAALVLGVAGLIFSLRDAKTGGLITGILAAVALTATMIDIKSKLKSELPDLNKARGNTTSDFDRLGDSMYIAVDFTPWFYIAVIAFAAGAFFCYKWKNENKQ
jgi:hypothetical protein